MAEEPESVSCKRRLRKKKRKKIAFLPTPSESAAPLSVEQQSESMIRVKRKTTPSSGGTVAPLRSSVRPCKKHRKTSSASGGESTQVFANIASELDVAAEDEYFIAKARGDAVEVLKDKSTTKTFKGRAADTVINSHSIVISKRRQKTMGPGVNKAADSLQNHVSQLANTKREKHSTAVPRGKAAVVPQASSDANTCKGARADVLVPQGVSKEVATLLRELSNPKVRGTLSDRLNSKHPCFDSSLKKQWKLFAKKERAMLVDCDKKRVVEVLQATASIQHPFDVSADDHCESCLEAYKDISPILSLLARSLGKKPATLQIYDPFYCAGAVVGHLGELGFKHVYNKCEDFYEVVRQRRVPPHEVVVTNPPYSGDHVERLLRWCRSNNRPFLLLMPNHFSAKPYYKVALGGDESAKSVLYLFPWKRYVYWTPKGMRGKEKIQSQHAGSGGNRTSPFVSFWYIDLAPAVTPRNLLKWWSSGAGGSPAVWAAKLCKFDKLPHGVAPDT